MPRLAMTSVSSLVCAAVLLFGGTVSVAHGEDLTDKEVLDRLSTRSPRDLALAKALAFLRSKQNGDGALGKSHKTALTSLAIMAHLAAGHTLDDPEHGFWLRKSVRYVLQQQEPSGYFGKKDGSRMYGHGIATLMLAEAMGTCSDDQLEREILRCLEKAVKLTIQAAAIPKDERYRGGWHYGPNDKTADLSLSGWQIMSLHATQQVGIPVPQQTIRGAVEYANRLTTDDGKVGYSAPKQDHPALRGLGMLCFAIGGELEDPKLESVANRIEEHPLEWRGPFFFYRVYYEAVGMSRSAPEHWKRYSNHLESILLENQNEDGSWPRPPSDNEGNHGDVYMTSMAALALAVERRVLPAYQR
ncbi:hypothetical protein Pan216_09490 [Planctomycetes bacterium Pan216]|uniref:Prenyltransferase and squalene oxidase repeat protein n=1 Tax=Kolteria novifilia TaxID=2527975 RepID=A0A518AZI1_9BACT|nr:hypothetical protein Pan216_09490 [Planctomycetes bacterium Pan216]